MLLLISIWKMCKYFLLKKEVGTESRWKMGLLQCGGQNGQNDMENNGCVQLRMTSAVKDENR